MLITALKKQLNNRISSFVKLWHLIKKELRKKWNYACQIYVQAVRVACSILKSWRKRVKKGDANPNKLPQVKRLFVKVHPSLYRFSGSRLRITTRKGEHIWIDLKFGNYQKRFIEKWKNNNLKIGEIIVTPEKVIVPFKKEVKLIQPKQWLAIDVNETNVTGVSSDSGWFIIDTSEIKRIRHVYFEKKTKNTKRN
ncbi:hypothetical protein [Archaeoglobus sp.]